MTVVLGEQSRLVKVMSLFFKMVWSGNEARWEVPFLLSTGITEEGQKRLEREGGGNRFRMAYIKVYIDITGNHDMESALGWVFFILGGAVVYTTNIGIFTNLLKTDDIPKSCYIAGFSTSPRKTPCIR